MARLHSHHLFILLSFVSSSLSFLTRRANMQHRAVRLSKLWDTENSIFSKLNRLQSRNSQNKFDGTDTDLANDCGNSCNMYGRFIQIFRTPNNVLKTGVSDFDSLLYDIDQNVLRDYDTHSKSTSGSQRDAIAMIKHGSNGELFDFLLGKSLDILSNEPSHVNRKEQRVSVWQSRYPVQMTVRKLSAHLDLEVYTDLSEATFQVESDGHPFWSLRYFQEEMIPEREPADETGVTEDDEDDSTLIFTAADLGSSDKYKHNDAVSDTLKLTRNIDKNNFEISREWFKKYVWNEQRSHRLNLLSKTSDKEHIDYRTEHFSDDIPKSQIAEELQTMWEYLYPKQDIGLPMTGKRRKVEPVYSRNTPRIWSPEDDELVSKRKVNGQSSYRRVFVHGHDDRHRVLLPQMRKFPFSNIARLSTGCTGTLATPRHVLTAAHCVHNGVVFRDNLERLKIEIPDNMGFKDYYAQKITVPTGWLRENRSTVWSGQRAVYDYAVVHLTLAVAGRTRFLPLAVPRPDVLQMDFHFLAFPEDDQQLWGSVCLASQHMALKAGNLIMTRCDATVGNSGAAVFVQDPLGGLRVVGILSNTMHAGHHRSFFRYSIITALTWSKLTHICQELGHLGQRYNVCPPERYMRRSSSPREIELEVIPFFGKRGARHREQLPETGL